MIYSALSPMASCGMTKWPLPGKIRLCIGINNGDCHSAMVGGVNLLLNPTTVVKISALGALSPVGRCQALDAGADGYGRGEGVATVLLEPQDAAESVAAIVASTSVNSTGRGSGVTAPSGPAQQRLIGSALAAAGLTGDTISAVSLHGTGTSLGDPIEVGALLSALAPSGNSATGPLALVASKTSYSHTEGTAGNLVVRMCLLLSTLLEISILPTELALQAC